MLSRGTVLISANVSTVAAAVTFGAGADEVSMSTPGRMTTTTLLLYQVW